MADLLKDFFNRDLSDAEEQTLADLISSSPQQSSRFADLAREAYLQTGLPNEGGSNDSGTFGDTFRLWGPIVLKIILLLAATGFALYALVCLLRENSNPSASLPPAVVKNIVPSMPHPAISKSLSHSPVKKETSYSPPLPLTKPGMVKPAAYDPNKKYEGLDIMVEQKNSGLVTVRALDGSNREVRFMFAGMLKSGKWDFLWDGKLDSGQLAQPGTYRVEVQSGKDILTKEIVIQGVPVAKQSQ
jgi:hypothetical protein